MSPPPPHFVHPLALTVMVDADDLSDPVVDADDDLNTSLRAFMCLGRGVDLADDAAAAAAV